VPQILRALVLLLGAADFMVLLDALPVASEIHQFAAATLVLLAALVLVAIYLGSHRDAG
jgi:hypothetical protein